MQFLLGSRQQSQENSDCCSHWSDILTKNSELQYPRITSYLLSKYLEIIYNE